MRSGGGLIETRGWEKWRVRPPVRPSSPTATFTTLEDPEKKHDGGDKRRPEMANKFGSPLNEDVRRRRREGGGGWMSGDCHSVAS